METLSRHFLKRRALAREKVEQEKLVDSGFGHVGHAPSARERAAIKRRIFVERAQRGPFRWRVVRR